MAASAALRLIRDNDIDPRSIGHLALGTETSSDNSAGAVIVRGMVDRALEQLGMPRLARDVEVPEYKHACLAGVYAVKGAARYIAADGRNRRAIAVCADIAEYERGSTGEQTQGAGAVALLLEDRPKLFELDLEHAGSASDYRGPDFRKPHARHHDPDYARDTQRLHDFPIFSGKYSTFAYLDETVHAVTIMARRMGTRMRDVLGDADALFFHRPYQHMPLQALAVLYVNALLDRGLDDPELAAVCRDAGVSPEELARESSNEPDLFARVLAGRADEDPLPLMTRVAAQARRSGPFLELAREKLSLGADAARELGNLYSGARFAWIAAALEEAAESDRQLAGQRWIAVGYGSGDAAEAIPMRVCPEWRAAAERVGFSNALSGARDLSRAQYEALHDGRPLPELAEEPRRGFRIVRVGERYDPSFQDLGVEYYEYVD
jgi:hydroxymethylglutaryl-CoA synthase